MNILQGWKTLLTLKFNKVNFKKRVRGGGGCRAGISIPRPRTKNSNFPDTCTRIQLNRLFPVKFGIGAGFVAMSTWKLRHLFQHDHIKSDDKSLYTYSLNVTLDFSQAGDTNIVTFYQYML